MTTLKRISKDSVQALDLKYEAVGVSLFREGEPVPEAVPFFDGNLKSYCQALMLAGSGRKLLLTGEQMGCKPGTSVLGFEKETGGTGNAAAVCSKL